MALFSVVLLHPILLFNRFAFVWFKDFFFPFLMYLLQKHNNSQKLFQRWMCWNFTVYGQNIILHNIEFQSYSRDFHLEILEPSKCNIPTSIFKHQVFNCQINALTAGQLRNSSDIWSSSGNSQVFFPLDFLGKYFKLDCTYVWAAVLKQSSACIPHAQIKYLRRFIVQRSAVTDMNDTQTPEINKILSCMCLWGIFINIEVEPLKRCLDIFALHPPGPLPNGLLLALALRCSLRNQFPTARVLVWEGCTHTRTYFLSSRVLH